MAVKKIITVPNPLLRQKSKPVKKFDKKLKKLADDLIATAKAQKDPEGVGLSSIQIGHPKRVFVVLLDKKFETFVNPKITRRSRKKFSATLPQDKRFLEGCLSVPGYYAFVDRPHFIKLKWQTLSGKERQNIFSGKQSAYIQHELDHCDGVLFTDRAIKQNQKIYQVENDDSGKEELVEVEFR